MAYELNAATLREMFELANFGVPDDDLVFVGLRGTSPIAIDGTAFASSHKVEDKGINHVQMRCSLIQWKPRDGTFAIFPGSTVPHRNTISSHVAHGGQGVNKLASCFLSKRTNVDARYYKGDHGISSRLGPHRAFRNDTKLPIWRTSDDADYEGDDTLQYYVAYDNIHCARQPNVSASVYSSNGCQVIAGVAGNSIASGTEAEQGPWKKFIRNAYGSPQRKFCYALFEEGEAQRAVELGVAGRSPTVRFGSGGQLVKALQNGLLAKGYDIGPAGADGDLGFVTLAALKAFQLKEFGKGAVDLIAGAMTAEKLGIEWPSSLSDAHQMEPHHLAAEDSSRAAAADLRLPPDAESAAPDVEGPALEFAITNETVGGKIRYYAAAEGKRVLVGRRVPYGSNKGLTNIYDLGATPGGTYDNVGAAMTFGRWAHFIWPTAMGESKGYYCCINTYDRARFTFGFSQLAAHTPNENLIVLYRRLLKLPSADRYFPDLTLVGGKVHQKISSTQTKDLEKVTNDELKDFMAYLNPDLTKVDDAEAVAGARMMFGVVEAQEHRTGQVELTIEIAKKKIARAVDKNVPIVGKKLRYAIWVFDILHQGRGGVTFPKLKNAVTSSKPEEELMEFGWPEHEERIKTVKASLDKLQSSGMLKVDELKFGEGDFA